MNKDAMKQLVCKAIDDNKSSLELYADSILKEPELGYKEVKTAAKTAKEFRELGFEVTEGLAITGVRGILKGKKDGPTIAVLGELDAIGCPESKYADPQTGAAHMCGHYLQLTTMLAVAKGLKTLFDTEDIAGNVVFFAVPAEEYVELAYRSKLIEEGKVKFLSGKQELIYQGYFDDIDMAMMMHSNAFSPEAGIYMGESSNGFIGKTIRYIGKEAHAAAAPHEGVNALYAAMLGMMGINALRETFRDSDVIRVHPIITKGGDIVNSIPADVRMETYVRAKTMDAIDSTHEKVDRALKAGGDAIGAKTEIHTMPGHLPLSCSKELNEIFIENAKVIWPGIKIHNVEHFGGSTDMGDVSHIIPALHPFIGGVDGALHSREFCVTDFDAACILPAKAFAMSIIDLLADDAILAKKIKANFKPLLTRETYTAKLEKYFI